MRFSDYTRLGKISINSRKKSTRNTVVGISFGLIMLVSVIFLTFAAFVSFNGEINKIRTIASFKVESKNFNDTTGNLTATYDENNYIKTSGMLSYASAKAISDSSSCEEYLVSNYFNLSNDWGNSSNFSYSFNDQKEINYSFERNDYGKYDSYNSGSAEYINGLIRVCNLSESNGKYILDSEKEDMKNTPIFLAGEGFTSATGGKQEIIISSKFADAIIKENNIAGYNECINKTLSFFVRGQSSSVFLNDSNDPNNFAYPSQSQQSFYSCKIMSDFKIAGIVNYKFFELITRSGDASFWITEKSVYYEENNQFISLAPEISVLDEEYNYLLATFKQGSYFNNQQYAEEHGLFFPFYPALSYNSSNNYYYYYKENSIPYLNSSIIFQAKNFSNSTDLSSVINAALTSIFPLSDSSNINYMFQNNAYTMFSILFTALQVVMLILYIFGGVLFVTSVLNLYNSINYSVQSRRNYIGMMRAIGAKNNSIPKMYLVEMILIFLRTLIWVLIFGFLICLGMKLIIDQLVKSAGEFLMGMKITLNLLYFPLALFIVYGVLFIIALAFALTACKSVSQKPILDVLRTEY